MKYKYLCAQYRSFGPLCFLRLAFLTPESYHLLSLRYSPLTDLRMFSCTRDTRTGVRGGVVHITIPNPILDLVTYFSLSRVVHVREPDT